MRQPRAGSTLCPSCLPCPFRMLWELPSLCPTRLLPRLFLSMRCLPCFVMNATLKKTSSKLAIAGTCQFSKHQCARCLLTANIMPRLTWRMHVQRTQLSPAGCTSDVRSKLPQSRALWCLDRGSHRQAAPAESPGPGDPHCEGQLSLELPVTLPLEAFPSKGLCHSLCTCGSR